MLNTRLYFFNIFLIFSNFSINLKCHKHSEHPLLFLISFDGFRWDYLKMYELPNFDRLKKAGSHANYIKNSFPTSTFPNHWTLVTGLYEESHGIIDNRMFDRTLNKTFSHHDSSSQSIEWFAQNALVEPIWLTNQRGGNGRRSVAQWPGASVIFPNDTTIRISYSPNTTSSMANSREIIDRFIGLFLQEKEPINFAALYFDQPDLIGHLYGPYSKENREKLFFLDSLVGYLIDELKSHHLFGKINVILTSDHGMENASKSPQIFFDDYVNASLFDAYGSYSMMNIFLKKENDTDFVYEKFKQSQNMIVYKKKDIPEDLHIKNNVRIGDLLLVAKKGYMIQRRADNYTLNGVHGYFTNESSMLPFFIAFGPSFRENFGLETFRIVDIYPMMCSILNVRPAVHNGSLENVKSMLVEKQATIANNIAKTEIYYVFVVFIVLTLLCIALVLIRRKRTKASRMDVYTEGYFMISTSDRSELIENDQLNMQQNNANSLF